jgi:metal-responsive CopG/Arc/MetJ family transcriptional regulator
MQGANGPQDMPRTIIDIPDEQLREIDRVCRALKISRAEAVRRGATAFLERNQTVEENGYGLWRESAVDAKGLLESIRAKW